ncbi:MAG: hypothetical protein LBR26_09010 [Prevotella sp.]|jgi:formyltetrahydrofolate synthetase|nr:hypothetical protein [Prevotella sp.]
MKTDIEIARSIRLNTIPDVADKAGSKVAIAGSIMRMSGLPASLRTKHPDIVNANIAGLC